MNQKIDVRRCLTAAADIYVSGIPNTPERLKIIEQAISSIQKDGAAALLRQYIGVKNYAHFGDQEITCEYGMGPKHGSVLFSIGRARYSDREPVTLGADHIYLLECVRDFGAYADQDERDHYSKPMQKNLCHVLRDLQKHQERVMALEAAVSKATVEATEQHV